MILLLVTTLLLLIPNQNRLHFASLISCLLNREDARGQRAESSRSLGKQKKSKKKRKNKNASKAP